MSVEEESRPIRSHEGIYEVSILGVRRIAAASGTWPGRILRSWLDRYGRPCVCLCFHGKQTTHRVALLFADAFLSTRGPTDTVLRHLNDDPTDNRTENLTWGTQKDNSQDAIHNGTQVRGITHGCAKLTDDKVRDIRKRRAAGESLSVLAIEHGVHKGTISSIVRRKTWKHVV